MERNLASRHQELAVSPRYHFAPGSVVSIHGVNYLPIDSDEEGHLMRRSDRPDVIENFTHAEIRGLGDDLREHPVALSTARSRLRSVVPSLRLSDLPKRKQEKILFRELLCKRFLQEEEANQASRSDASMTQFLRQMRIEVLEREMALQTKDGRCGTNVSVPNLPSPTTLRRWLRRFEAFSLETLALCDRYARSGNMNPRIETKEREILRAHAHRYASRLKPTKAKLYQDLKAEIHALNEQRVVDKERLLTVPSLKSFEREIARLDPYHVYAGREGAEAARKKFFIVSGKHDVAWPLERVEFDETCIPLQTILMEAGVWSRLPDTARKKVERERLWLSTAMDAATRCVLAARLVPNPSAATALATLKMAVTDKQHIAAAAGCHSPWDMHGVMDTTANDNGASYVSHEYRAALTDLRAEVLFTPAGLPQMRGRKERFYRTLNDNLVSYFQGRTFENVVAKGDYDSEKMAVLDADELGLVVVRYLVDVYHNTPHSGLAGETPRNCWLRLTKQIGVRKPPHRDEMRHIFGTLVSRKITNEGVRILGLDYQSNELQELRRTSPNALFQVRIDPDDLGDVSVYGAEGWLTVKCVQHGLDGVAVADHITRREDQIRKFAAEAKASESVVFAALQDIRRFSDAATERAGIASQIMTTDAVERLDRIIFCSFERDDIEPQGDPILGETSTRSAATATDRASAIDSNNDIELEE